MNYSRLGAWSFVALGWATCALLFFRLDTSFLWMLLPAVFLFFLVGVKVALGSRIAAFIALLVSMPQFCIGLAAVISCLVHPVVDVGLWRAVVDAAGGAWAFITMALLCQPPQRPAPLAEAQDPESPAREPERRPFQYSLRSLFVLTFLVAIACWLGTRPLLPSEVWSAGYSSESYGEVSVEGGAVVEGYRSGALVAGYMWRKEARARGLLPMGQSRSYVETDREGSRHLLVDGKPVQPTSEFQLFVDDSHGNLVRFTLSQADARKIFGKGQDVHEIKRFWKEVVEPTLRKKQQASAKK